MKRLIVMAVPVVLAAASALAQEVPKALQTQPQKFYWASPSPSLPAVQKLNLTPEQRKSIDDIFQQHRLKLIDLEATLQKEELILEPLVAGDPPDEAKVLAQIDRVAQARAELEKANSRMLWQVRRVLTPDQWKQLQPTPFPLYKPKVLIK
ncbi:MAG TPA: Spy/CpxP family protein refolding chaperone [Bryobacteraceae bacterium]|nr:Spy/CpxP family protein refolding chaperone [Bryobacteraceae bacterium]